MLDFKIITDPKTGEKVLETHIKGKALLTTPQLNKSTAFTEQERHDFHLKGKLPSQIESLDEQVVRTYLQFDSYKTKLQKNIYLNDLHDTNQVLFYRLVRDNIKEMMPLIYTPIVGTAVKKFSLEFRKARGLYISYKDIDCIDEILDNRSNPDIDVIVVTDGEGVLGIGDQGIGAMDIPVAKLMVYSLCGGINPLRTLPIMLDVGTNNQQLLDDPLYLGLRHARIRGAEYDKFIEAFVNAVKKKFPNVFLHWEDFGRENARRILNHYRNELCTFNDDIQGTGAVTLAAMLAAVAANKSNLTEQRIIIFGAGSAGTGITDQICDALVRHQLDVNTARKHFWLIDRDGLVTDQSDLTPSQKPYARSHTEIKDWDKNSHNTADLLEVIKQIKPTILIGTSGAGGAFTEDIIKEMASHCERPIIFPLSNPTERSEATPHDIMHWTNRKALIATGSPFPPVEVNGQLIPIAQCNNALVFPGIGLGLISAKAMHLSDNMLWEASKALSQTSPINQQQTHALLPSIEEAHTVALDIAVAIFKQAVNEKYSRKKDSDLDGSIQRWEPNYIKYVRIDR